MPIEKPVGTVIAYKRAGYGWLDCDGTRVWIHVQDARDKKGHLMSQLKVGWTIQFDVTESPKGPRARNAVVVETAIPEELQCQPQPTL
jgi:cold shock CspA family protein